MRQLTCSREIAEVIREFLEEEEWSYSFDEEKEYFDFILRTSNKIKQIHFIINVHPDEYVAYGIIPVGADSDDAEMMTAMAEFICRANYGLKNGCFEMDFRDGEIRYKTYVDCEQSLPSKQIVENSIHCIAAMYKRYIPGIADIIFAGSSAKEAVEKCEQSRAEELRSLLTALGEDPDAEDMKNIFSRLIQDQEETCEDMGEEDLKQEDAEDEEIHVDLFGSQEGGAE